MPKYPKTTKVELWRDRESYQDEEGAWHAGRPTQLSVIWANFKGKSYDMLYQTTGVWAKPTFEITITRPKFTVPQLGDHIRHEGKFYEVKQINDLTGQAGHDMKLVCELDEDFRLQ